MVRMLVSLLFLFSLPLAWVACGGDDDGGENGPFAPDGDNSDDDGGSTSDDDQDDNDTSSEGGAGDQPSLPAGSYGSGTLHLTISGDVDQEIDFEDGAGFSGSGFGTIGFTGEDTLVVSLTFGNDDIPGGVAIVTDEVVTGAEWRDCELSIDEAADRVEGEFSCDDLQGHDAESSEAFDDIDLRGEFSLVRQ